VVIESVAAVAGRIGVIFGLAVAVGKVDNFGVEWSFVVLNFFSFLDMLLIPLSQSCFSETVVQGLCI
jgi:hypothetical protein